MIMWQINNTAHKLKPRLFYKFVYLQAKLHRLLPWCEPCLTLDHTLQPLLVQIISFYSPLDILTVSLLTLCISIYDIQRLPVSRIIYLAVSIPDSYSR